MGIEWFRDLVICISGVVAAIVFIFVAIMAYRIYRRAGKIMDSIQNTTKTVQGISSFAGDQVIRPLIEIAAIIQGVRQSVESISRLFKKGESGKND